MRAYRATAVICQHLWTRVNLTTQTEIKSMFQGFLNEKKLGKKEKRAAATPPPPSHLHLLVPYFGESTLRHPRDSRVTKATQVQHICGILHRLGARLNGTSIRTTTRRVAVSKAEKIERQK